MKPIGLASGTQFAIALSVPLRRSLPDNHKALLPPGSLSVPLRAQGHLLTLLKLFPIPRLAVALQLSSVEYHTLKPWSGFRDREALNPPKNKVSGYLFLLFLIFQGAFFGTVGSCST